MSALDKIKGKLGFGCMRLPVKDEEVDFEEFSRMIDAFMEAGFNYFDTARMYLSGKSETALRECLVKRYQRESFFFTNKLTRSFFNSEADILPLFEDQLKATGLEYFDLYLMHAQSRLYYDFYKECHAYEIALKLKEEGKIKHFGISFHDDAATLDRILTDYPEIEVVQLQFNYLDYNDATVQARKCYEVARKHGKLVAVMEPVRGGALVKNLPPEATAELEALGGGSLASYAIRFAAGFDGILTVLSGMGNMDMMLDNISYMKYFKPLDEKERKTVDRVAEMIRGGGLIPCTACRYCTDGCPMNIAIPELFACLNGQKSRIRTSGKHYYSLHTTGRGKASDCIGCGACESACPQHLKIRELLSEVAEVFEEKK